MKNENLESKIGYQFQDKNLLEQALTHSSFANERHMRAHSDNERLEFLGDAVLEAVSSEFLYLNYPDLPEGRLTPLRASLVCEPTLAIAAREIGLGAYLRLSRGEDLTGGRERDSILSDALESVIGAVFLDGGLEAARKLIIRFILTDIEHKQLYHDSKTKLQELVQAMENSCLEYVLVKAEGPDHARHFVMEAQVDKKTIGRGEGRSKKAAEQEAAYRGLLYLKERGHVS